MAYETLLLSDKDTVVLERIDGGKIRATSGSWADMALPGFLISLGLIAKARHKTAKLLTNSSRSCPAMF